MDADGSNGIERLVATRHSLHAVAEHLLAGDLHRRTGKIGLRVTPGGFGQPEILGPEGRRRMRVDGSSLVVLSDDSERWHPLTTGAELAAFAGSELGPASGTYQPETAFDPTTQLDVDPGAADLLADWFDLVERSLEQVRRDHSTAGPSIVQLWPEHFDVACVIGEVNLGGSPGDDDHPEPYLYVGPWAPRTGPFWNETWGASLTWREVSDVESAVEFMETGLVEVAGEV